MGSKFRNLVVFLIILIIASVIHFFDQRLPAQVIFALSVIFIGASGLLIIMLLLEGVRGRSESRKAKE